MATSRWEAASGPVTDAGGIPASVSSRSSSTRVPVPNWRRATRKARRSPGPRMWPGLPSGVSRPCSRRHRWMIAGCGRAAGCGRTGCCGRRSGDAGGSPRRRRCRARSWSGRGSCRARRPWPRPPRSWRSTTSRPGSSLPARRRAAGPPSRRPAAMPPPAATRATAPVGRVDHARVGEVTVGAADGRDRGLHSAARPRGRSAARPRRPVSPDAMRSAMSLLTCKYLAMSRMLSPAVAACALPSRSGPAATVRC